MGHIDPAATSEWPRAHLLNNKNQIKSFKYTFSKVDVIFPACVLSMNAAQPATDCFFPLIYIRMTFYELKNKTTVLETILVS